MPYDRTPMDLDEEPRDFPTPDAQPPASDPPTSGQRDTSAKPPTHTFSMTDLRESTWGLVQRRRTGTERPTPTPWKSVNDALGGGFWPGFYTLTSGTGAGKTQWALAAALAAAQAGWPVHYVALELSGEEVYARLLALALRQVSPVRVPWSALYRGECDSLEAHFAAGAAVLDGLPLTIEVAPPNGWPVERLAAVAAGVDGPAPRLIVVDFIQLLAGQRNEDPSATMSRVAYAARQVARDHHCSVLALSSTARSNYGATSGTDKEAEKPGQGDPSRLVGLGKYAGDLEFAADGVLALVGDGEYEAAKGGKRVHVAVAKNRGGRAQWCGVMRFDGCSFETETAQPQDPAPEPTPSPKGRKPGKPDQTLVNPLDKYR